MTVAFIRTGSLPLRVLELATDNVAGRTQDRPLAGQHFGERLCGPVGADDPKHGEAAHGIDRGDAARCPGRPRRAGATTPPPPTPPTRASTTAGVRSGDYTT